MLEIDLDKRLGPVRPLHGVNLGPLERRWTRDFSEAYRRIAIPSVRLHDASIYAGEVVDLHCVFPNPAADPDDPASYEFSLTDHYLAAIRATGAEPYFRLGESIDFAPRKLFARADRWTPERMARVCANIVRHYNRGWAAGHEWGIENWEFWCEPENRWHLTPEERVLWVGSASEFFDCYQAVAPQIKAADPSAKVGLAGFTSGFTQAWLDADPADRDGCAGWVGLLARCVEANVPVDFVSWHRYTDSWSAIAEMAVDVRRRLDDMGLQDAESHLTEWNYVCRLQDQDGEFRAPYTGFDGNYTRYERAIELVTGPKGAAFTFGALAAMQTLPLDIAHFYTGVLEPYGLFSLSSRPNQKLQAFEAFAKFVRSGATLIGVGHDDADGTAFLGAASGDRVELGIAHLATGGPELAVGVVNAPEGTRLTAASGLRDGEWREVDARIEGGAVRFAAPEPGITTLELGL